MENNRIVINTTSIIGKLALVAVLLVLASLGLTLTELFIPTFHSRGLFRLFYVDQEKNIPTGFSTFLLLIITLLLAVITVLKKQKGSANTVYWAILTIGFLIMVVDEAWSFHEKLIGPMRRLLGGENLGVFYYAWVIPGIALILIVALFFYRFLLRLPKKTTFSFLMAAVVYLGGCIGFELIGGWYAELHGTHNLTYRMIVHGEEGLEMAGLILYLRALMLYIADDYKEVRFRFQDVADRQWILVLK